MWLHSMCRMISTGICLHYLNSDDLQSINFTQIVVTKIVLSIVVILNAAILIGLSYLISFHTYLLRLVSLEGNLI